MRRKHNLAFHLVMLLLIIVSTILVFYRALVHLRSQIDEMKINSVYRVLQIGEDYEMLLSSNENMINSRLKEIFVSLESDLKGSNDITGTYLNDIAMKYGLDYILLANESGKVTASTDENLEGREITKLMPGYHDIIIRAGDENKLLIDRLGLLTDENTLYKSAWYVDMEKDQVLIYGIDMYKYLKNNNSVSFAEYLFGGYFVNLSESILLVSNIDLRFRQGNLFHSILGQWTASEGEIKSPSYASIESQIINNYEYVILPITLSGGLGLNQVEMRVSFNNDTIRQISSNLLFRALFGFVILAVMIYLIVYVFFKSMQKERETIMLGIVEAIRKREFRRDIFERGIFKQEVEDGIIELAETYQGQLEINPEEFEQQQKVNEKLRDQVENEHKQVKSLLIELKEIREQCDQMQRTDRVTGLPNREILMEYLDYEGARADREKTEFSILIIKLKNLCNLHTAFGSNFTEYLLNKTGSKLRATLRLQDRVGKWDEDEFLLILPTTGSTGIRKLIAKLEEVIALTEFYKESNKVTLELLFGGVVYTPGMKVSNCLQQSEVAIQEAEQSGIHTVIGE